MVDALRVAADLLADHTPRVGVAVRAAHPADGVEIEALDLQRAGARAVVRAHRREDLDGRLRHGFKNTSNGLAPSRARDNGAVGTPIRPLPDAIARWSAWVGRLRALDALAAWGLVWGVARLARPGRGVAVPAPLGAPGVARVPPRPPIPAPLRPVHRPVGRL